MLHHLSRTKLLLSLFFLNALFLGGIIRNFTFSPSLIPTAHAAEEPCQKLGGDTTVVEIVTKDDKGKQYVNYNSGQNFFEGKMPSVANRPIFLAPDDKAACAQKVGDTVYLKGWFWNDNLGWISFYCPGDGGGNRGVQCGFVKYGVQIDNFGNLSGYAWSTIGWIRFTCKATPGVNDETICAQSLFKVKVDFNAPANNRTWFPYVYAWSNTIGWFMFDSIKVPWFTLPDTQTPECKTNVNKCLREKDLTSDEKFYIQANEEEAKGNGPGPGGGADLKDLTLKPGIKSPADDFPTGFNKVKILGNLPADNSALSAVNKNDMRNVLYPNALRWKGVASKSCGDKGGYLTKFSASDEVFFCKGDVHLNSTVNNWKGNKTVIVEDGNVYIEGSLYSDGGQFGIIALRKNLLSNKKGHVFIGPSARELRVQIYADGSVLPVNAKGDLPEPSDYAISSPDGSPTLFGQLYIRGMIIADNSGTLVDPEDEDAPLPESFAPTDLAALRSVPADPGSKTPITWDSFYKAVEKGGDYMKVKVDEKTGKYLDEDGVETKLIGDAGKIKMSIKKVAPDTFTKLQQRRFDKKRVNFGPKDGALGVFFQFEPPSPYLGVFEATRSNTYKQTR